MVRLRQSLLTGVVALALALGTAALAHDLGVMQGDNAVAGSSGDAVTSPSTPRPSPAQISIPMDADAMESASGDAEMERSGIPIDQFGMAMGRSTETHTAENAHMAWTNLRPADRADSEHAAAIIATLRAAISK